MKTSQFVKISGAPILDFTNTFVQHASHIEDRLSSLQSAEFFFRDVFDRKVSLSLSEYRFILARRKELRKLFDGFIKSKHRMNATPFWPFNGLMKGTFVFSLDPVGANAAKMNRIDFQLQNSVESTLLKYTLDFLQNFDPDKLKKCHNENCSHFFYDTSKASVRVWCSMKSCGNLAKVRKFRRTLK